jgi:hypothetical protein
MHPTLGLIQVPLAALQQQAAQSMAVERPGKRTIKPTAKAAEGAVVAGAVVRKTRVQPVISVAPSGPTPAPAQPLPVGTAVPAQFMVRPPQVQSPPGVASQSVGGPVQAASPVVSGHQQRILAQLAASRAAAGGTPAVQQDARMQSILARFRQQQQQ